jgi:hypothetical protein
MRATRKYALVMAVLVLSSMGGLVWAAGTRAGAKVSAADANRVLSSAAQTEFGSPAGTCEETIAAAAAVGVDYRKVVALCLARDRRGMHLLLWLTSNARLDAASAEGHAAVLGEVLRSVGDEFFSRCLQAEPATVRKAVRDELFYDLGSEPDKLAKYPRHSPDASGPHTVGERVPCPAPVSPPARRNGRMTSGAPWR